MMGSRVWFRLAIVSLAIWGSLSGVSRGQEQILVDFNKTQKAIPPGWELYVTTGDPRLQLVSEADGQVLQLQSKSASFAIQRKVDVSLQDTPVLVWKWKVTQLPEGGDFRQRATDDQAAQLIVAFSASRFISYIWDSTVPKGTFGKAPTLPFRRVLCLVMQSGPQALGNWITERRNLVEDYTRLFGEAPKAMRGLRIQINSQHTRSHAESYWKSIVLTNTQHAAAQSPEPRIASWAASAKTSIR